MNELLQPDKLLDGERVDARTLWVSLESKQQFSHWIKNRLEDFAEGTDYTSIDKTIYRENGGNRQTDYLLSLNTAKHICLLERSEPGRKIRQYLIEVEKLWNSDDAVVNRALQIQNRKIKLLESKVSELEPKAAFFDQVADSKDAIEMRNVAAVLNIPGLGRNKLFALLRDRKVLDGKNIPYRSFQERGYFRVIEKPWFDSRGEAHVELVTLTFQKGLEYIRRLAQGIIPFPGTEATA
jgi:anti-repressor protein